MPEKEDIETGILEEEQEEDTQEGKFLTFALGKEEYGIAIRVVTEIIGIQNITILPDMPSFVKGVINLRGKIIPVIDVRLRFNLPERDYNERTCIVVVNINNIPIGLIVDNVSEVLDITAENIEPPSRVNKGAGNQFIKAFGKVDDDVKIILDTQRLLFDDELEQLTESLPA